MITEVCFATDPNLGKLCKWLRILGFDARYERNFSVGRRLALAAEGRWLLTRITALKDAPLESRQIFIRANEPFEQLRQVIRETGITLADVRPFTRCIRCNRAIKGVDKTRVLGRVPDYIAQTRETFHECPGCGRFYWEGSHGNRMRRRVAALFEHLDEEEAQRRGND